jgi:histidinol phosphatase-like PHP family hydrolase
MARDAGAQIVVCHGETVVEPVAQGTNLAAIEARVDVLAHPGLITEVEVRLAAEYGVALEITTRRGHSYANGHVAALARRCGARLVIDNDAHAPGDLVSREMRQKIGLGAGLSQEEIAQAGANGWEIVERCRGRR